MISLQEPNQSLLPPILQQRKPVDSATDASNLLSLLQEPFKKRRGRKPKAYYEQKALLEQQLAEQRAKEQVDVKEPENEDDVLLRSNEYRKHPLFNKLELFDSELNEFIQEKRKQKMEAKMRGAMPLSNPTVGYNPSNILLLHPDGTNMGKRVFLLE